VIKPQKDDSIRLEVTFTEEQMNVLKQAKDLLSHTLPEGSWAEVLTYLAEKHVQKISGKNQKSSPSQTQESVSTGADIDGSASMEKAEAQRASTPSFTTQRKRGHIRITVRRRILAKAQHCCEYVDPKTQQRCQGTYQLQVDHRIPLARGGSDEESNLRALCRTHNLLAAKHWGLL
jgi:5-methylcytosine-specific restriction endonuclease McrA